MDDETLVTPTPGLTSGLGGLADVVVELSRHLDLRSPELRGIVELTGTEVAVIRAIHHHPRASPSQVATTTGLARSNISTALRTLEARGLVVREHPPGDRRTVELVATDLAEENVALIHRFWEQRLSAAPPDVRAAALRALPALQDLAAALARG
jgi:DNA-binding MarR family transcriptional regulator